MGTRPRVVLRATRVPRRLGAGARDREGALRPVPRGVRRPAGQDPGARRLAAQLCRRGEGARPRALPARAGTGRARAASSPGSRTAATCSPRSSRRRSRPSTSRTASRSLEQAVVEAFDARIEFARTGHVDKKTELQEALARSGNQVQYQVVDVEGPPHDRRFVCVAVIAGEQVGIGKASTKKAAEQEAARQALESLGDGCRGSSLSPVSGLARRRGRRATSVRVVSVRLDVHLQRSDPRLQVVRRPDRAKLEPGVAVVVGPNGSGKSNVADAIVWAAGSLTPSELRAEKPDDVLFGGAANRPAADHCEVELVFDNEDGGFGDEVDYSEIAITRRLVRGGEGQYLVNKAAVRRTDLVELLADVGPRRLDALDRLAGKGRRRARLEARGQAPPRRGGGRARQVQAPQAPGRAEARAGRDPGRARKGRRGGGAQAAAAACAAGDCRRAGREARDRDRRRCGRGSPSSICRRDRSPGGRRGPPRCRRDRPPQHARKSYRTARGAPAGRGRAVGRRRRRARRRSVPSTGCREPPSGSCCVASRRPSSSSDFAAISPRSSAQR